MIVFEELNLSNEIFMGLLFFIVFYFINVQVIRKVFPNLDKKTTIWLRLAILFKFSASIAFGLIHLLKYRTAQSVSDTANYHLFSVYWNRFIFQHHPFTDWFLNVSENFSQYLVQHHVSILQRETYCSNPQLLVVKTGAIVNLISNNSYYAKAIVFASIGFIGLLFILKSMKLIFDKLDVILFVIPLFFVPSVVFWTSGFMKEPLCLFAVGMIFYSFCQMLINKKLNFLNCSLFIFFSFMLAFIKTFLFIVLTCSLVLFTILYLLYKLPLTKKNIIRYGMLILTGSALTFYMLNSRQLGKYSISKVIISADSSSILIRQNSKAGSTYENLINAYDPLSILKSVPPALNVAMFRPYLWEAKNILFLVSALESALLFILTVLAFFTLFRRNCLKYLLNSPAMISLLVLSFIHFYFMAISSSNFGTLVRYKAIYLPFYLIVLFILIAMAYADWKGNKSFIVQKGNIGSPEI